jgi:hypothetical protein
LSQGQFAKLPYNRDEIHPYQTHNNRENIVATVAIVGAGLMGTAVAYPLADNGHTVRLVGTHLDGDIIQGCREHRYHQRLKREIPSVVQPYYVEQIAQALDGVDIIVSGVNSLGVRWIGQTIGPYLRAGQLIIAVTKGVEAAENGDLIILPDVLARELPVDIRDQVSLAAIGGPCIAGELAGRRQGCVIFGSRDRGAPHVLLSRVDDHRPGGIGDLRSAKERIRARRGVGGWVVGAGWWTRCGGLAYVQPGSGHLWPGMYRDCLHVADHRGNARFRLRIAGCW